MGKPSQLHLAPNLILPLETVTQRIAILARTGAGKTYTAAKLAEEMLKVGVAVVVLDPLGGWWGLRAGADRGAGGLPITIFGGDHADVPLEPGSGEMIANLIVKEHISAVLDLSRFRKGEQHRFVTAFAERLHSRNRHPLHLMIDEADSFAPQRPQKGEERMLGAVEDIVRRGRMHGLGVTLISQRSAVLNKNVLTQAAVLIAMQTTGPQDRDAINAWVDIHGDKEKREKMMESIVSLAVGEAWVWAPAWLNIFRRVKINRRETFDSSATPKFGRRQREPKRLASVDLRRIKEQMAESIERVKQEDPRELRRQVLELRQELQQRKAVPVASAPAKMKTVTVKVPVIGKGVARGVRKLIAALEREAKVVTGGYAMLRTVEAALLKCEAGTRAVPPPLRAPSPAPQGDAGRGASARRLTAPPAARASTEGDEKLVAGERRLLDVLSRVAVPITSVQAATLAGLAPGSGTTSNYLRHLADLGLTIQRGRHLELAHPSEKNRALDRAEVINLWKGKLVAGERRMLDVLLELNGKQLALSDLGERVGMSPQSGTFSNYMRKLRDNGLAEVEDGQIRLSETMFLGT